MRSLLTLAIFGLAASTLPFASSNAAAEGTPAAPKQWTILVYLNGANSLSDFGAININQMEQVGSTADVNVVVQWTQCMSQSAPDPSTFESHCATSETKRLLIQKDSDTQNVTSPVVQDMGGSVDMGVTQTLVDFAQWGITNYPANHYLVDVWDHGEGWHAPEDMATNFKPATTLRAQDISLDETTGHWITTPQLGAGIAQIAAILGRPLDVYASDACMMQMAEIAAEMQGSVQVFAGSEEVEPGDGWSYADFLNLLTANPTAAAKDVGTYLEKSYLAAYSTGGTYGASDVTFSAIDMSLLPAFVASMKDLGSKLSALSATDAAKALTAANSSLSFTFADYIDASDFMTNLQPQGIAALGTSATASVKSALDSLVIGGGGTGQYANAKGLAIWVPKSTDTYNQFLPTYQALKFDQQTSWSVALKQILASASN